MYIRSLLVKKYKAIGIIASRGEPTSYSQTINKLLMTLYRGFEADSGPVCADCLSCK